MIATRFAPLFAGMLATSSIVALAAPEEPGVARAEPEVQMAGSTPKVQKDRQRPSRVMRVALDPATLPQPDLRGPKNGTPLQVGYARPVPPLDRDDAPGLLQWDALANGGSVAAFSVASPGAAALRIGLRVNAIPGDAKVRFYSPDESDFYEVSGEDILAAIARNLEAGEHGPDAHIYWSPVIEAAEIVVEIELPPGARPQDLRIAAPLISHLVTSAKTDFVMPKVAAACENDVMCSMAAWGNQSNAVARMLFTSGGSSFLCTGTLLADTDPSTSIPYFLSANHCINTQSSASSLITYWFYRSTACNSGVLGPYQTNSGGATLLYNTTATDTSFMRLNTAPPAGAVYAGWIASTATNGQNTTAIHHPTGDMQKISSGNVAGYFTCTAPSNGSFSCSNSTAASGTFYGMTWRSGVVEPGSSGSAVFDDGQHVIAQLYGGSSTCSDPTSGDFYGRFDVAYNAALKSWLSPPPPLTVTKAGTGGGTVTSSPTGINCGATCSASFASGTSVTLTAAPDATSFFAGWNGGGCSGTSTCHVTLSSATSVTATFNTIAYSINVTKTGTGTVTSSPIGLNCGSTCSASFATGTAVTLTASTIPGNAFIAWGGACSGALPCTLTLSGSASVSAAFGKASTTATDFDRSGKPDLLWRNTASGATYAWFMNGLTRQSDLLIGTVDPVWKLEGTGDFNGDGNADIVWRNTSTGVAYVWFLVNGVFQSDAPLFAIDPQWKIEAIADFNMDGKPDLLMRDTTTGVAFVWFYNGTTPTGSQFLFSIDPSWQVRQAADFNLDGKADLLFRNAATGLAFVWNTGWDGAKVSLGTSSPPIFTIDPVWDVAQAADWNGDGMPDLVFRNKSTGVVFVWYMNGTTLGSSATITQIDPSWEIVP